MICERIKKANTSRGVNRFFIGTVVELVMAALFAVLHKEMWITSKSYKMNDVFPKRLSLNPDQSIPEEVIVS